MVTANSIAILQFVFILLKLLSGSCLVRDCSMRDVLSNAYQITPFFDQLNLLDKLMEAIKIEFCN